MFRCHELLGALLSGVPETLARRNGWHILTAQRLGFVLYAVAAVVIFVIYRSLHRPPRPDPDRRSAPRVPLATSRRTVLELATLFSLDSAGSGFVVTSLLVLWLHLRFDLSAGVTGTVFAVAGLLGACSQALAPRLARRWA